ncbi:protein SHQ1 homolog [Bicyclus anynana]|uniref:Protein SHQ1 homolog n=1 Tax=Bicyclus anynana TaxID=110368 RepID=A0A6J1NT31_BICAN|nr:protein SHQ1 homolog [Bicyclus anynana]
MLTPRFKIIQDENRVFITIHAPYTNIGETEIDVDGEHVLFVSAPYFLRLRLPGRIVENDLSEGSYCCESGDFKLKFDKETPGEHFENLDMITSLLAPRDIPDVNPNLVEMLEEDGFTIEQDDSEDEDSDEALLDSKHPYGFANSISTEFKEIGKEFPQIFELRVPELVPVNKRNSMREQYEERKFSSDHYLADYFDKELLAPYLAGKVVWEKPDFQKDTDFTEEEVGILKELPNKHYILTKAKCRQVFYGLIDLLYGYCYDKRTTMNDSNVESSWTINKLSATLSWFCVFNDMKEVLVASYRRALTFPIFRNYDLCNKVKDDLASLLKKGKKYVIKCIINMYQMFNLSHDARYILNQLYIKDYLIFLQKCKAEKFEELGDSVANINISKNDVRLELVELEMAAVMVQQEESQIMGNELAGQMASMSLIPGLKKSSAKIYEADSSSSDSSSDSSDDDSSDLDSDDVPF